MSRESKYLAVACPICRAKAGEKCFHFVTDKATAPHSARKAKLEKTKP